MYLIDKIAYHYDHNNTKRSLDRFPQISDRLSNKSDRLSNKSDHVQQSLRN